MAAENGSTLEYKDLTAESLPKVMDKVRRLIALSELKVETLRELEASLANRYGIEVVVEWRASPRSPVRVEIADRVELYTEPILCPRCGKGFGADGNERARVYEGRFWHVYNCKKG